MFVIANNITTRKSSVKQLFRQVKAKKYITNAILGLEELTEQCVKAGADALEINIQQYYDTPEAMEFAVNTVQRVTDRQLCLSSYNLEAIEAGLQACKKPPIINYISMDETALRKMFPLVGRYSAEAILLVSEPTSPTDVRDMLDKAAVLIGTANECDIPNERLLIDPGLIHINHELGQRHLINVIQFLRALPEVTEPPVRSTCWLSNISSGIPRRLHSVVEAALLPMLAGFNLNSVFMDVLRTELSRTIRLIETFNNRTVYSDAYIEG